MSRKAILALVFLFCMRAACAAPAYDPLAVPAVAVKTVDLTVKDTARKRDVSVLAYLPATTGAAPVVLFSHGLGGSREGSAYLGRHWAGRGYVVLFVQHLGSDDSVWRTQSNEARMEAMREAASVRNLKLRIEDVKVVLDQLPSWNAQGPLKGRLDTSHVGMSGHSFGALTTQWVSGESLGGGRLADSRIKAAVIMSPSAPRNAKGMFKSVSIPWLLMTGTRDVAPIGAADVETRLAVFPALPAGDKYELVLFDAQHSAFTDRALPGDAAPRNANHHRAILALSTAFWDAYLRGDAAARAWLQGNGPRTVLEPRDGWRKK